jgi:hypothetical protein
MEERFQKFHAPKKQVPLTESNKETLQHFKEYKHTSPVFIQKYPYKIESYRPMDKFLPSSVIVLVTMHGRTKEPFILPVNVTRHIGTDFGTCYADANETLVMQYSGKIAEKSAGDKRIIIAEHFQSVFKDVNGSGEYIKKHLIDATKVNRKVIEQKFKDLNKELPKMKEGPKKKKLMDTFGYDILESFLNSKHHDKPKHFKAGMPMFNKAYTMEKEKTHEKLSIYVRADLPLERVKDEDFFFEIQTKETTLKEIFQYLADRGVTDVTLFDHSCQPDRKDPIHHKRYGGN